MNEFSTAPDLARITSKEYSCSGNIVKIQCMKIGNEHDLALMSFPFCIYRPFQNVRESPHMFDKVKIWRIWGPIQNRNTVVCKRLLPDSCSEVGHLTEFDLFCLSDCPIRRFRILLSVDSKIEKIRAIEFA